MPRAKTLQLTPAEEARRAALLARKKELAEEERELLAKARERIKREQAKASKRERKADTFRKVLVGIAVLDEAEKNPALMADLIGLLTRFFTTERERAVLEALGVPPLSPRPAPAEQSEAPDTPSAEIAAGAVRGFGDGLRMVRH
jgi:hypothetical protein